MEDECTEDKDEGKDEPEVKKKKRMVRQTNKKTCGVCVWRGGGEVGADADDGI